MRNRFVSLFPLTCLSLVMLSGCATKGQLRKGLAEQQALLQAERAEREAADQRLAAEDQRIWEEVGELRTELEALRRDFGAQITRLEEGLQFAMPVHFAFDRAEVRTQDRPVLDRFADVVRRYYPNSLITVEGFTDPSGPQAYNRRLAKRRSDAVRAYLVERGMPAAQLRTAAYGEARPVVPNAAGDQPGAELNRRVVFVVESGSTGPGTPVGSTTMLSDRDNGDRPH